jgi:hypothetical protein
MCFHLLKISTTWFSSSWNKSTVIFLRVKSSCFGWGLMTQACLHLFGNVQCPRLCTCRFILKRRLALFGSQELFVFEKRSLWNCENVLKCCTHLAQKIQGLNLCLGFTPSTFYSLGEKPTSPCVNLWESQAGTKHGFHTPRARWGRAQALCISPKVKWKM